MRPHYAVDKGEVVVFLGDEPILVSFEDAEISTPLMEAMIKGPDALQLLAEIMQKSLLIADHSLNERVLELLREQRGYHEAV